MNPTRAWFRPCLPWLLAASWLFAGTAMAQSNTPTPAPAPAHPQVELKTSQGDIVIELFSDRAPKTVANFLRYVKDGYYAGTVFHRVVPGFLVQGGLYTRELRPKRTLPPVSDEADNGLSNLRGTVAAARGHDPDSATSQFFFNLADNPRLDYIGNQSGMTWGYAVFGKVIKGMAVVDKIAQLPTGPQGPFVGDVPRPLVIIESAHLIGGAAHPAKEPLPPATGKAPAAKPDTHPAGGH